VRYAWGPEKKKKSAGGASVSTFGENEVEEWFKKHPSKARSLLERLTKPAAPAAYDPYASPAPRPQYGGSGGFGSTGSGLSWEGAPRLF